jgi:flagellar basal-body rod protein FlgB
MILGDTVVFGMMNEKMAWHAQRQRVLSQNLANADTPDYRARDLAPLSFDDTMRRQSRQVQLAVTDPQHVTLPQSSGRFDVDEAETVYETSLDGNAVVLEEQMMKMGENAGDYNLATSIYRKYLAMHRAALGRGGGGG